MHIPRLPHIPQFGLSNFQLSADSDFTDQLCRGLSDKLVDALKAGDASALSASAASGEVELVRLFIEKGLDVNGVNIYGETALMKAADVSSAEAVKLLLESGADASARARDGRTALDFAVERPMFSMPGMEDIKVKKDETVRVLKEAMGE